MPVVGHPETKIQSMMISKLLDSKDLNSLFKFHFHMRNDPTKIMVRSPWYCPHWYESTGTVEYNSPLGSLEKYKGPNKLVVSVNFREQWYKLHHPLLRPHLTSHVYIEKSTRFSFSFSFFATLGSRIHATHSHTHVPYQPSYSLGTKDLMQPENKRYQRKTMQEIPFSGRGENPLKASLNAVDWLENLADSLTNLLSCTGVWSFQNLRTW